MALLPLIVFQYPLATGQGYPKDTLLRLCEEVPTIRAVKDWIGNVPHHEWHVIPGTLEISIPGLIGAVLVYAGGKWLQRRSAAQAAEAGSEAATVPWSGSWAFIAPIFAESTRLIWPAPTPTVWPSRA